MEKLFPEANQQPDHGAGPYRVRYKETQQGVIL